MGIEALVCAVISAVLFLCFAATHNGPYAYVFIYLLTYQNVMPL